MTQKAVLPEADARRLLKACGLSRAALWDTEVLVKKLNTLLDMQEELTPPTDRDLALLYGDCIQALQEGLELDLLIEEPPAEPPQEVPAATTTTPKKRPQRKAAARARQATKLPQEPPADISNTPPKKAPRCRTAEDPSGVVPSEPPQETPAAPPARQSKKAPQKASADTPRPGQERPLPSKARLYLAWKDGQIADVAAGIAFLGGAVTDATIRSWMSAWRKGTNIPTIGVSK